MKKHFNALSNEEFQSRLEHKCLDEYVNNITSLRFVCEKHGIFKLNPCNYFQKKVKCKECVGEERRDKNNSHKLIEFAQNKGGRFLSEKYTKSSDIYDWECSEGHVWKDRWDAVLKGRWCHDCKVNECSGFKKALSIKRSLSKQKYNTASLHELATINDGECISKEYIKCTSIYQWRCNMGHIFSAPFGAVKYGGWCRKCRCKQAGLNKRKNINDLHKAALDRGGKCLSTEYTLSKNKYEWQCIGGHKWSASLSSIIHGSWCPVCTLSKGEIEIDRVLRKTFNLRHSIDYFTEHRFLDCKNKRPLAFDFYIPDASLIIEYDGVQHFRPMEYFGGLNALINCQKNDLIKNEYCNKNKINIIRIAYWQDNDIEKILLETFNKIYTFTKNEMKQNEKCRLASKNDLRVIQRILQQTV